MFIQSEKKNKKVNYQKKIRKIIKKNQGKIKYM